MIFTSVRGYIIRYKFDSQNKLQDLNKSITLYKANIYHNLNPDSKLIKDNNIIISRTYRINKLI